MNPIRRALLDLHPISLRIILGVSMACMLAVFDTTASADDDCLSHHWVENVFCLPGTHGTVISAVHWDDGTGPALYIGGSISDIACVASIGNIVRWDGQTWSVLSGPHGTGVDGTLFDMTVYDDGSGPALYVGGSFLTAGGISANRIARWDGHQWTPLIGSGGSGDNGVDGHIRAMAVYDDGSGPVLYVGGNFANAGGIFASHIARWDGSEWTPITVQGGNGVNQFVSSMVVHDDGTGPALYVGGAFTSAGGAAMNRIARWNGGEWSRVSENLSNGVSDFVSALTVHDDGTGPALYAGGLFLTAGINTVNRVARWNGSVWTALPGPSGIGVNESVSSLASFDDGSGPALYAGGSFTFAGGVRVNRIAKWTSSGWSPISGAEAVGVGPNSSGDLSSVRLLAVTDVGPSPALFVGGSFSTAGGLELSNLALLNADGWAPIPSNGGQSLNGIVNTLSVFDDGDGSALYAGGTFTNGISEPLNAVARWNGSAWTSLSGPGGVGLNGHANSSIVYDDGSGPALYLGGSFTSAAGVTVNGVARWDGAAWSPLFGPAAAGVSGGGASVQAFAVYDDGTGPALYVSGAFNNAGGEFAGNIARWDGDAWTSLTAPGGTGTNGFVAAMTVFDDGSGPALYAGGGFSLAGGVQAGRIARWNGVTWSALIDTSISGWVYALTVFDDGTGPMLYAGGAFTALAGLNNANRVVRWNGATWSRPGHGFNGTVNAFTIIDDGDSPTLYAGGEFTFSGALQVNRIARWNGSNWDGLGSPDAPNGFGVHGTGSSDSIEAMTVIDDGSGPSLYVGGRFTYASGVLSSNTAQWRICPSVETCPADLNGDGILDFFDVQLFLGLFAGHDFAADLNGDGILDFFDIQLFLNVFAAGCP